MHHVKLFADSFGVKIAKTLGEGKGRKLNVEGLIKPSAKLKDIVLQFERLQPDAEEAPTSKDFMVLIGCTNDIYCNETGNAVEPLMSTLNKLTNTNVVYVNTPHRHDLIEDSVVNREIATANTEFNNICLKFDNVSIISTIACNRKFHTWRHGQQC